MFVDAAVASAGAVTAHAPCVVLRALPRSSGCDYRGPAHDTTQDATIAVASCAGHGEFAARPDAAPEAAAVAATAAAAAATAAAAASFTTPSQRHTIAGRSAAAIRAAAALASSSLTKTSRSASNMRRAFFFTACAAAAAAAVIVALLGLGSLVHLSATFDVDVGGDGSDSRRRMNDNVEYGERCGNFDDSAPRCSTTAVAGRTLDLLPVPVAAAVVDVDYDVDATDAKAGQIGEYSDASDRVLRMHALPLQQDVRAVATLTPSPWALSSSLFALGDFAVSALVSARSTMHVLAGSLMDELTAQGHFIGTDDDPVETSTPVKGTQALIL
jgi:hypothetical protein